MITDIVLMTLAGLAIICTSALLLEPIYCKYKAKSNKRKRYLESLMEDLDDAKQGMKNSVNNPNSLIYYDVLRENLEQKLYEVKNKRRF